MRGSRPELRPLRPPRWWPISGAVRLDRRRNTWPSGPRGEPAAHPHLDLRGASRLGGANAPKVADFITYDAAGRAADPVRHGTWATPISSCCRSPSIRYDPSPGATSRSGLCSPHARGSAIRRPSRAFVDRSAQAAGLGVILDWVPAHFPTDEHGLARFDGTALYEHADPRQGLSTPTGTRRSTISAAPRSPAFSDRQRPLLGRSLPHRRAARRCSRLDALPRLFAQRGRMAAQRRRKQEKPGGDRLPAARQRTRLRRLSGGGHRRRKKSTAFPGVSRPTDHGGLGFGFKWNMGWMHDTLDYVSEDPIYRRWHHNRLTFELLLRLQRKLRAADLP